MLEKFTLKIYRGSPGKQYWEEFVLNWKPMTNITSALMEIRKNPINSKGDSVKPVVWEQGCLEEVCGSCSMLINGKPRQACTALVDVIVRQTNKTTITLAPFTKFPLVKDLIVDRSIMFENLKKIHAWIDVDTSYDRGFGPKISPQKQEAMYALSKCMTCGCCSEACPQINDRSKFIGPAAIGQVRLFNTNPTGAIKSSERLKPMMEEGGVSDCGNAQNCVRVCPKDVPLTDAIAVIGRDVVLKSISDLFNLPDRSSN
jgi:succinate dehydrogenase / fumarate reductase iron-sulfur subunit